MTWNQEMVSIAPIPIRVFFRYDANIICNDSMHLTSWISDTRLVENADDFYDANWDEECVGLIGMTGHEVALATLHLINELPLDAVDVVDRPVVGQWLLSFLVDPHLESFLHLNVTPNHTIEYVKFLKIF